MASRVWLLRLVPQGVAEMAMPSNSPANASSIVSGLTPIISMLLCCKRFYAYSGSNLNVFLRSLDISCPFARVEAEALTQAAKIKSLISRTRLRFHLGLSCCLKSETLSWLVVSQFFFKHKFELFSLTLQR